MDNYIINNVYQSIKFEAETNGFEVEVNNQGEWLFIRQYKNYNLTKYKFRVSSNNNMFLPFKVKLGTKWVDAKTDSIEFDINKPFSEIQIGFSVSNIPPLKKKVKVVYAKKEDWDKEAEEIRINKLNEELNLAIGTNLSFAWIVTAKPKWMDHFTVSIKWKEYDFACYKSDKNNHLFIDSLPDGVYTGLLKAYDSKEKLIFEKPFDFKIRSRANDPEHSHSVTFSR